MEVDVIFPVHNVSWISKNGSWVSFYKSRKSLEAGIWLSERSSSRKAVEWQGVGEGLEAEDTAKEGAEPWPVRFTGFTQNFELESTSRAHFCLLDFIFSETGFPECPFPRLWLQIWPGAHFPCGSSWSGRAEEQPGGRRGPRSLRSLITEHSDTGWAAADWEKISSSFGHLNRGVKIESPGFF